MRRSYRRRLSEALKGYKVRHLKIVSIVDDDESVRTATASLVRSMGWGARTYESADEFLDSIAIVEFGCIVCDIEMPGTTGLELIRTLYASGYSPTIIFVTGYFSDKVAREATARGALCVLEKPVDPTILCDWLSRALDDDK